MTGGEGPSVREPSGGTGGLQAWPRRGHAAFRAKQSERAAGQHDRKAGGPRAACARVVRPASREAAVRSNTALRVIRL